MKRRDKPCNEKRDERRDAEETGGGDGEDKHGGMACQNDIHMPIGLWVSPPDRIYPALDTAVCQPFCQLLCQQI